MEHKTENLWERMTEPEWVRGSRTVWRSGLRGRRTLSLLICRVVWSCFPLGLLSQEMDTWEQNKGDAVFNCSPTFMGGKAGALGTMRQGARWDMTMAKVRIVLLLQRLTLPPIQSEDGTITLQIAHKQCEKLRQEAPCTLWLPRVHFIHLILALMDWVSIVQRTEVQRRR